VHRVQRLRELRRPLSNHLLCCPFLLRTWMLMLRSPCAVGCYGAVVVLLVVIIMIVVVVSRADSVSIKRAFLGASDLLGGPCFFIGLPFLFCFGFYFGPIYLRLKNAVTYDSETINVASFDSFLSK
jgi:hypothetical protein